jgi:hypothetical protein
MDGEEIRTVYISGFPPDVKEREINLLFRKSPGFEGAFVKYTGVRVAAWANFDCGSSAMAAIADIEGYRFDPSQEETELRASLARSNTKSKRPVEGAPVFSDSGERPPKRRVMEREPAQTYPYSYPFVPNYAAAAPSPVGFSQSRGPGPAPAPSNTLYMTTADPACTEAVMQETLRTFRGFIRLKVSKTGRTFFAEFSEVDSAAIALAALQGQKLGSGFYELSVQYAKSQMKQ